MGPCFKSYISYKFDQPETIHDWAKMNLAIHHVWRLSANFFEPWESYLFQKQKLKKHYLIKSNCFS